MMQQVFRVFLTALAVWIGVSLSQVDAVQAAVYGSSAYDSEESGRHGVDRHTLGAGSPWQTTYFVVEAGSGPIVMVVAGLHGNEPAGSRAAERVKDLRITRGTLIVLPRANTYGLSRGVRGDRQGSDLNRDFPRSSSERADTPLARAIWDVVERYRPDWLLDLHEGYDYHVRNDESVGQSIIYDPNGSELSSAVRYIVERLNRQAPSGEQFSILKYPAKGGIARSASDLLGTRSMIIETNRVDDRLSRRVDYHVTAVRALLDRLRML